MAVHSILMRGFTFLMLYLSSETALARTLRQFEHVKWRTSMPGKTCGQVCTSAGTGVAVTMDEFENAYSGHSLCGTTIGNQLLVGTTVDDNDCRVLLQPGTNQVQTLKKGSYTCGCDTASAAAMYEWKHIGPGCPASKMTRPTVICSGEVYSMEHRPQGITHYAIGYAVAEGEFSQCATPDGMLAEFNVLCDYP